MSSYRMCQDAQKVLANGPRPGHAELARNRRGAAYGVSQASPSGGINAVWVMPEAFQWCSRALLGQEADPATLAELASKSSGGNPAYAPKNIQPYQAPGRPLEPESCVQVDF